MLLVFQIHVQRQPVAIIVSAFQVMTKQRVASAQIVFQDQLMNWFVVVMAALMQVNVLWKDFYARIKKMEL